MNEVRKFYRDEIKNIQRKIRRREKWLRSDEANKTDTASNLDRSVVEREVMLLERDMDEARMMLKRCAKN